MLHGGRLIRGVLRCVATWNARRGSKPRWSSPSRAWRTIWKSAGKYMASTSKLRRAGTSMSTRLTRCSSTPRHICARWVWGRMRWREPSCAKSPHQNRHHPPPASTPNMYLAKVAMDIVAKHMPADKDGVRVAELNEMSYRRLLWDHRSAHRFLAGWARLCQKLEHAGLMTMGDIARCSVGRASGLLQRRPAVSHVRCQCRTAHRLMRGAGSRAKSRMYPILWARCAQH